MEHYARLLNVEFEWPSDSLPEVAPVAGPPPSVSAGLVRKALIKMKCGKAAGLSGIIAEMLKAAGESINQSICDVPRLDVLSTASLCPAIFVWTYVTCFIYLLWL